MTDTDEGENWDLQCIVCGKSVDHGGGMAHFKVEGEMIALCCPLCIETFNKNPKHYIALRQLRKVTEPKQKEPPL